MRMRIVIAVVLACAALTGGPAFVAAGFTALGLAALVGGGAGAVALMRTAA